MKIEVSKTPLMVAKEVACSGDFASRIVSGCAVMAPADVPGFWDSWEGEGEYPLVGKDGWACLVTVGSGDHRTAVLDCGEYAVVLRQDHTLHPGPYGWMWEWWPVALVA